MGEANKTAQESRQLTAAGQNLARISQEIVQLKLLFQLTTGQHLVSLFQGSPEKFVELPMPVDHGSVNDIRCEAALAAMNLAVI